MKKNFLLSSLILSVCLSGFSKVSIAEIPNFYETDNGLIGALSNEGQFTKSTVWDTYSDSQSDNYNYDITDFANLNVVDRDFSPLINLKNLKNYDGAMTYDAHYPSDKQKKVTQDPRIKDLAQIKTLEHLELSFSDIIDYSDLSELPNLKYVSSTGIKEKELDTLYIKNTETNLVFSNPIKLPEQFDFSHHLEKIDENDFEIEGISLELYTQEGFLQEVKYDGYYDSEWHEDESGSTYKISKDFKRIEVKDIPADTEYFTLNIEHLRSRNFDHNKRIGADIGCPTVKIPIEFY